MSETESGLRTSGASQVCSPLPDWHTYVPPVNLNISGRPSLHVTGVPRSVRILVTGCDQKVPFMGVPSFVSLSTGSSSKHPFRCVSMATATGGQLMM